MVTYKVYQITNIVNNKIYVGITKERYLSHRFWAHANKKPVAGSYLHSCIKKYGINNFQIKLLYEFPTALEAKLKEVELISTLHLNKHKYPKGNGMNLTDGGEGSYGCKHSPESILKMSGVNNHNYGLKGFNNPTSRSVNQLTKSTVFIQMFGSLHQAANSILPGGSNTQLSSIASNIRGSILRQGNAYGYKWEYVTTSQI